LSGVSAPNLLRCERKEPVGALYCYRARYYAPALHRFISEDPIGFRGGDLDLYAYVRNNPLNFQDPTGTTAGAGAEVVIRGAEVVIRGAEIVIEGGKIVITGAAGALAGTAALIIAVISGGDTTPKCPSRPLRSVHGV